jgi:hypothetical protein
LLPLSAEFTRKYAVPIAAGPAVSDIASANVCAAPFPAFGAIDTADGTFAPAGMVHVPMF